MEVQKINNFFSIIIPAYNNTEFLKPLLNDLIDQRKKYPQTEIIVIDDGSTEDMSWLDNLNIISIHQENKGPSSAHNKGLDIATGNYIAFIDSDDSVVSNYLDIIYEEMNKGYNCVGYLYCNKNEPTKVIEFCVDVWGYTFTKDLIGKHRFDENIWYNENKKFLMEIIKRKEIYFCNKVLLYYNSDNQNSLLHKRKEKEGGNNFENPRKRRYDSKHNCSLL